MQKPLRTILLIIKLIIMDKFLNFIGKVNIVLTLLGLISWLIIVFSLLSLFIKWIYKQFKKRF